ncbi:hypothetical protein Dimus_034195, partial [Dionaea muscipula]
MRAVEIFEQLTALFQRAALQVIAGNGPGRATAPGEQRQLTINGSRRASETCEQWHPASSGTRRATPSRARELPRPTHHTRASSSSMASRPSHAANGSTEIRRDQWLHRAANAASGFGHSLPAAIQATSSTHSAGSGDVWACTSCGQLHVDAMRSWWAVSFHHAALRPITYAANIMRSKEPAHSSFTTTQQLHAASRHPCNMYGQRLRAKDDGSPAAQPIDDHNLIGSCFTRQLWPR